MTAFAVLESPIALTVKFLMNPISNYTVDWFLGDLFIPGTKIKSTVFSESFVLTTYYISNVTTEHLGIYNVKVINWAIRGEHNAVTFHVILALAGEATKVM